MDNTYFLALFVGIAIMMAIYISLMVVFNRRDSVSRRAFAVFSAAVGLAATVYLARNPALLDRFLFEIVGAAVALVVALLVLLRRRLS